MTRGRKIAVAAVAAVALVALLAPAAVGHTLSLYKKAGYDKNGQRGTYLHYVTHVPARHRHRVSCPSGYKIYPARLLVNGKPVHVAFRYYDDEEPPPFPPGQEDERNERGRHYESHRARVTVLSKNFESIPDPSDFDDQGPRYGRSLILRSSGRRSSRLTVVCYRRFN